MGTIRKSLSPYASAVVIAKKKNGLNRNCADYRKLNKLTILDPKPMKTSKNLFRVAGKVKIFFKIDLSKTYWQIPGRKKMSNTAFVTLNGAYEFLRMPFYKKNYDATLVCRFREVISSMSDIESYIHKLIVFSSN